MLLRKRKSFLTVKHIRTILKAHGGIKKYLRHECSTYDQIVFYEKDNKYHWLTIRNKAGDTAGVTLTDDTGRIIHRELWIEKDSKHIECIEIE